MPGLFCQATLWKAAIPISNTSKLTELRKEHWAKQVQLAWLKKNGDEERAFQVRKELSSLNAEMADLIWKGAVLCRIEFPELDDRLQDALGYLLTNRRYGMSVEGGYKAVFVTFEDGSRTMIINCDDPRPGYYQIEGRVQSLEEWLD